MRDLKKEWGPIGQNACYWPSPSENFGSKPLAAIIADAVDRKPSGRYVVDMIVFPPGSAPVTRARVLHHDDAAENEGAWS